MSHPINEPWLALEEKLKSVPSAEGVMGKFSNLKNSFGSFSSTFDKLKGVMDKLKSSMSVFDQMLWVQKMLNAFSSQNYDLFLLKLSAANSKLVYNEIIDNSMIGLKVN